MPTNYYYSKQIDRQAITAAATTANFVDPKFNFDSKLFKCIVATIGKTVSGTQFEKKWIDEAEFLNKTIAAIEECKKLDGIAQQM